MNNNDLVKIASLKHYGTYAQAAIQKAKSIDWLLELLDWKEKDAEEYKLKYLNHCEKLEKLDSQMTDEEKALEINGYYFAHYQIEHIKALKKLLSKMAGDMIS